MSTAKKAKLGTYGNMVEYDPTCPVETKKAFMQVFNLSEAEYDAQQARRKAREEEEDNKYPHLKNLVWVNTDSVNVMYYVDDKGKKIDKVLDMTEITKQMLAELKEKTPDDVILVNGEKLSRTAVLLENLALVNQK